MRKDFKWLVYGQLGTFMWHKKADPNRVADPKGHYIADKTVIYADNLLRRLVKARECRADTVLFDIGEAIQYPSHPELWIDGCLDAQKARALVGRMKDMGYEVIPSLNFSTDHHHWLCQYSRMISTPDYYRVCEDVIRDTWEICGHPAVFHLGYDEEDANCTFSHAKDYPNLVYVRQGALYWHDLAWFCDVCRKLGSRPSFWLDKPRRPGYSHETFVKNVGKDVLLTPWDYTSVYEGNTLPKVRKTLDGMVRLADAGYDMIPVGSNWILPAKRTPERQTTRDNIPNLFAWSKKHLNPDHFAGFGVAPWAGVSEVGNPVWFEAAELLRDVKVGDESARSGKGTSV